MNIGAPELLIVIVILAATIIPIIGVIRAAQNGDTGWLVGIVVTWFIGLGWLVAIIYLAAVAPGRTRMAP